MIMILVDRARSISPISISIYLLSIYSVTCFTTVYALDRQCGETLKSPPPINSGSCNLTGRSDGKSQ
ncbi:uncharacterized protein BO87DRAFT_372174 [Aspergillus neoniger CBS 115656]|uniref:Uncharacterized protein n=1 Tax=Aspergillus neoniger (strain CBS 115656) TaxID=1448310 RepID=A0A318Z209_ASPNB|nr:hypothetical protein BO87DRAFT_372174 [Aspergillus neoniger CBS 115656]PYH38953.1 hypothetical protein BO87DRAFT_372174 [Aspergillus neoniger CBS 115656]